MMTLDHVGDQEAMVYDVTGTELGASLLSERAAS